MANYPWTATVAKATDSDKAEIERLIRLSDRFTPELRDAFKKAIDEAGNRLDIDRLATLVRSQRYSEAIDLVSRALIGANASPLAAAIAGTTFAAAGAAARQMPKLGLSGIEFSFDEMNPATVKVVDDYAFGLIRELGARTRASVGAVIRVGVKDGRNPLAIAQDIRDVGLPLTEQQSRAVLNYRRMLEQGDREAFTRALRSRNFDQQALRVLADKKPLPQALIDRMVDRYRRRYVQYRSETIGRTEAIRAVNAGNMAAWQQAVDDGTLSEDQVIKRWIYTHDNLTRDAHRLIPSMNEGGVGLNDAFESILGPIMYPGDPLAEPENTINCRCAVVFRYRPQSAR
jgi:hypothetical protein